MSSFYCFISYKFNEKDTLSGPQSIFFSLMFVLRYIVKGDIQQTMNNRKTFKICLFVRRRSTYLSVDHVQFLCFRSTLACLCTYVYDVKFKR